MENASTHHLQLLNQLAREYHEKFQELEDAIRDLQPEAIPHQLRTYAEMTTDRFRGAQQALFESITPSSEEDTKTLQAATAMCRCFDQMRILFQVLLEHCPPPED